MADTPGPFRALPGSKVLTDWGFLASLIAAVFGAAVWATWVTFELKAVSARLAAIEIELKELRHSRPALADVP